ncbi:heavy metal translocating P-type ATPase [Roseivivax sp. CAU 1761]
MAARHRRRSGPPGPGGRHGHRGAGTRQGGAGGRGEVTAPGPGLDVSLYAGLDRAVFSLDGLYCPSCARAVEKTLHSVPGVRRARVSFATASAAVVWRPGTDLEELAARVSRLGFGIRQKASEQDLIAAIDAETRRFAIRLAVATVFGAWTMAFALVVYLSPDLGFGVERAFGIASGAASLPVLTVSGLPIFLAGYRTLRAAAPGMDTLVALGVAGSVIASVASLGLGHAEVWFDTAVMLITFLLLARVVEMRMLRRTLHSIAQMKAQLPETALILEAGGTACEVAAEEVREGDVVRVPAGERCSLDGILCQGRSLFDTAILTGEAMPRPLQEGERVEAGFVNLLGLVDVRVTREVGARRIDLIGASIDVMRHNRQESARLSERLAGQLAPGAVAVALATFGAVIWSGGDGEDALFRALSVLVVACPCALSLAAPLSHLAGQSAAAKDGIHMRRQDATVELARLRTLVFDKTGTLTAGQPAVRRVVAREGVADTDVLAWAAAAEGDLRHPLAEALRRVAPKGALPEAWAHARAPDGVSAQLRYGQILVGNLGFLARHGVALAANPPVWAGPRVEVAWNGRHVGTILFEDAPRADARSTLDALRTQGIRVLMATGDNRAAALATAEALGFDPADVHSGMSPEDKVDLVTRSVGPVGFVGDGVNDCPALAAADVAITGSDAAPPAVHCADIVAVGGGLTSILTARDIAERTRRIFHQNLVFAVLYNALALTLAVHGAIPPAAAALAMAASSASLALNASRGRSQKTPLKPGHGGHLAPRDDQTPPIPLHQDVPRDHPPRGHASHPLPAVAAKRCGGADRKTLL